MSFLHQLKTQASALQEEQRARETRLQSHSEACENACRVAQHYVFDLARQLDVLMPPGPRLTLDGKTPWPPMKLVAFRSDARRKSSNGRELMDHISMGWDIVPQHGAPVGGVVTVNFPPDLDRVTSRLSVGGVEHERRELRHPEKNTLQAIRFEYITRGRGSLTIRPDHDAGTVSFRLVNVSGFGIATSEYPAGEVTGGLLDELAKLLVGQPSRFAA